MTVSELIERLREMPQDAPVITWKGDPGGWFQSAEGVSLVRVRRLDDRNFEHVGAGHSQGVDAVELA